MKWLELFNVIATEHGRFENAPVPVFHPCKNHEELLAEHKRVEIESRPQVDASVKMFAREQRWPSSLSANEQYFLAQRTTIALIICGYLASPKTENADPILPQAPESFDDEDLIEWLLIYGWHRAGWRLWLDFQRIRLGLLRGERP